MWFGTRNGLNRYDGRKIKLLTEKNGMQGRKVIEMAEDQAGFIWLLYGSLNFVRAADGKVDLMNVKTNTIISFNKRFKNAPFKEKDILWLKSDGEGSVFIWVNPGYYYFYNPKNGFNNIATCKKFTELDSKYNVVHGQFGIMNKEINKQDVLTPSGLWPLENQNHTCKPIFHIKDDKWMALTANNFNEKTSFSIVSKDSFSSYKKLTLSSDWHLPDNKTYSFYNPAGNNAVVCCIGKGIYFFNGQITILEEEESLGTALKEASLGINYYFQDRKGRIVLCSINGVRIYEIKKALFRQYFQETSGQINNNTGNQARGIAVDNTGNIYCHLWNDLKIFDKATAHVSVLPKPIWEINYPLIIRNDSLYSFSKFIDIYSISKRKHLQTINFPNHAQENYNQNDIWSALYLNSNKLICGFAAGIKIIEISSGKVILPKCSGLFPTPLFVYQLFVGSDNKIYATCSNGLFILNSEGCVVEHYSNESKNLQHKIPIIDILHVCEDKEKNFWIATNGDGLYQWNRTNNHFRHFTVADGLSSNLLYRIETDASGYLWISSDYGLMRFDRSDFSILTFTTKDGLTSNEFNRISSFKATDGSLYFGSINGIVGFDPEKFHKRDYFFKYTSSNYGLFTVFRRKRPVA